LPPSPSTPSISPSPPPSSQDSPTSKVAFNTDYIEARLSKKKGIGVFAIKTIPEGMVISTEEPLMLANVMDPSKNGDIGVSISRLSQREWLF
jgi:hypothetical protein